MPKATVRCQMGRRRGPILYGAGGFQEGVLDVRLSPQLRQNRLLREPPRLYSLVLPAAGGGRGKYPAAASQGPRNGAAASGSKLPPISSILYLRAQRSGE